jgi:hypothetical protein
MRARALLRRLGKESLQSSQATTLFFHGYHLVVTVYTVLKAIPIYVYNLDKVAQVVCWMARYVTGRKIELFTILLWLLPLLNIA